VRPHRTGDIGTLAEDRPRAYGHIMASTDEPARLTESLARSVSSWGARLSYGEAVVIGGQDVVPVAFAGFGFGAGEGAADAPDGTGAATGRNEGSGGGGGGFAIPVGAYVSGPGGVTFRPNPVALVVAVVPLVATVGVAVAQVVRAARTRTTA